MLKSCTVGPVPSVGDVQVCRRVPAVVGPESEKHGRHRPLPPLYARKHRTTDFATTDLRVCGLFGILLHGSIQEADGALAGPVPATSAYPECLPAAQ